MVLACCAGVTQLGAVISGDWATPANTLLLVVLATLTIYREREARKQREFVAKQLTDVHQQITDEPRTGTFTRKDDPPPWQPPSP